jgi:hypothetical protein
MLCYGVLVSQQANLLTVVQLKPNEAGMSSIGSGSGSSSRRCNDAKSKWADLALIQPNEVIDSKRMYNFADITYQESSL